MTSRLAFLAAFAAFVLLAGCNRPREESTEESASNARVPVSVQGLVRSTIVSTVSAPGRTEALRREKVVSPVTGRIVSLKVLEGSFVRAGDVLVTLRTREAQAALEGAEALLRTASTEAQRAEAARARTLADSLQGQVLVRASLSGIVATRSVAEGELVAEQAELLTLIDPETIIFVADVPTAKISGVKAGLSARVRLTQLSEGALGAAVDAVSPEADAQSQSVRVRLRFLGLSGDERRAMKSNLAGTVLIGTETRHDVFVVGRSSLLHDDESDAFSVVVMSADSLARIIPVTIGAQTDSVVEIRSPLLREGQQVITRGQYALADSTRVTVEPQ